MSTKSKSASKSAPAVDRPKSWSDVDHLVHLMAWSSLAAAAASARRR